jgi:AcrR family transcriptional regulator
MSLEDKERETAILTAAAQLIIRYGYNKLTMTDIADAVGLSRGLIYLHFKSKDEVLEALIAHEMLNYGALWLQHIESDPQGGTVASIYRSVVYALNNSPLMASIVKRDEKTFGKYLRKPGNLFESLRTPSMTHNFLAAMQAAGVVRQGVNIAAMAFILDAVSYAMVSSDESPEALAAPAIRKLVKPFCAR